MGVNLKFSCSQGCLVFAYTWKCGQRSRCTHTTRARTFVSVAGCVSRKLRPCPSYSGRRDRNNSVHWRSLYKGGGGTTRGGRDCDLCLPWRVMVVGEGSRFLFLFHFSNTRETPFCLTWYRSSNSLVTCAAQQGGGERVHERSTAGPRDNGGRIG